MCDKIKQTSSGQSLKGRFLLPVIFLFPFYCVLISHWNAASAGRSSGVAVLRAVSPRQQALGGASVCLMGDVNCLYTNPAGLGTVSGRSMSSFASSGLSDDFIASFVYGRALPTDRQSSFATGVFHLNGGKLDITYTDGTSNSVTAESDVLAAVGWGGYLIKDFLLGYSAKYFYSSLASKYTASAVAADVGFIAQTSNNFRIGALLQNYGTELKFKEKKEPLPFAIKGGIALNFPLSPFRWLYFTVDTTYMMNEKYFALSSGVEYTLIRWVCLRAGYRIPQTGEKGFVTAGAGLRFGDGFSLDWATEDNPVNRPNNVSLAIKF
jgi:hypothetical protein